MIALGRIGLPTALVLAKKGYEVIGIDINETLVRELNEGKVLFYEQGMRELLNEVQTRFRATTKLEEGLEAADIVVICLGTRKYANQEPNLKSLERVVLELAEYDIRGKLIVFKSTVPIGTTRKLTKELENRTGYRCGKDFYVAYCPERTVEGKAIEEMEKLPKVIGAMNNESLNKAVDLYSRIGGSIVQVENPEAAEAVKLIDNTYRITMFAFANDVALLAETCGLDAHKLIESANKDYPRNNIPFPSSGVGGYCLTKDPYYLEANFKTISKKRGFWSIWLHARKVNDFLVEWLIYRLKTNLARKGISLRDSRVLICGIAYKANIDDARESHGLAIARELHKKGVYVTVWDPWVTRNRPTDLIYHNSPQKAFEGVDAAIFTVKHHQFETLMPRIQEFVRLMRTPVIFDGAGIFRDVEKKDKFELLRTGNGK